jgi:thymidylate synthase (FAD)
MSDEVKLLDHGFIRLVDYMGGDLSVVRAARVSYDADWRAGTDEKSDAKLIRYLWRNRHTTPFEAVTLTLEVKAPIFVFRQWHRHRTQSYNELSARYRELPGEFYVPAADVVGVQSATNKQGRDLSQVALRHGWGLGMYQGACEKAFEVYRDLLAGGWPRELARAVLPVSTYSHMFATANLKNWFDFLTLRTDPHAQYEIRQYANAALQLIQPVAPTCVAAWMEAPP